MTTFTLYSDGQLCRAVIEGTREASLAVADGYDVLATNFATKLDAWCLGAADHGLLAEDYDDRMMPTGSLEKRTLFRSVSPRELGDIVAKGAVMGGGNGFNDFEHRPFAFFSPTPSVACIWQGEELERQAEYLVVSEAGGRAAVTNENVDELRARHRTELARLRAEREGAKYTSVVIETFPVGPCFHYSTEHGRTGMNGEDEFGLFPGTVKLADIATVHLVLNQTIIETREAPCWDTLLSDFGLSQSSETVPSPR